METKFTKGEWIYRTEDVIINNHTESHVVIQTSDGKLISSMRYAGKIDELGINDAKLISAAPDLYDALEDVTEQLTVFSDMDVTNRDSILKALNKAKQALQKATK